MSREVAKNILIKLFALFTVVRGYNVLILTIALYFSAFFVFTDDSSVLNFIQTFHIHFIIISSALTVSAGYIINNFYDLEKDKIGRPLTAYLSKFVSQNFKLITYLTLNLLALLFAFFASWRVALFFIFYQFLVWLYSHKLNKILIINNIFSVTLSLMPFLALFLYYRNYQTIIFYHALFLGLNLLIIDFSKDFYTKKADAIYDYNTLPITLGMKKSKLILGTLLLFSTLLAIRLQCSPKVGYMSLYFKLFIVASSIFMIVIFFIKKLWKWRILHIIFKFLLFFGVISLVLIKLRPENFHPFFEHLF